MLELEQYQIKALQALHDAPPLCLHQAKLCTSSGHAVYLYQVLRNYLQRYQSYRMDTISILKITKGNNSAKRYNFHTYHNTKLQRGIKPPKNVEGVTVHNQSLVIPLFDQVL